jgi:hypothetical protein
MQIVVLDYGSVAMFVLLSRRAGIDNTQIEDKQARQWLCCQTVLTDSCSA